MLIVPTPLDTVLGHYRNNCKNTSSAFQELPCCTTQTDQVTMWREMDVQGKGAMPEKGDR